MKRILTMTMLTLAVCIALPVEAQWKRTPTPNDTLQSVRRLDDGSVVFSIYAPKARTVSLGGDGDLIPWQGDNMPVVEEQPNGVWTITVKNAKDGIYRYHFLVDGIKVFDPKNELAGETSAIVKLQSQDNAFFSMRDVPHGALSQRWYWSKNLNTWRRMHVWTPAGYENSREKLPVLYLIHGGGDTDNAWPGVGCANLILDNLLAEGKMKPMVVVMPNGTLPVAQVHEEIIPFAEDMLTNIIPFVEQNYRVLKDKDHRAVAGLSMGGMETLEVVVKHPELFSYAWVLSSGLCPGKEAAEAQRLDLVGQAPKLNKSLKKFIFTQGGESDIAYYNYKDHTRPEFEKAGICFEYEENAQAGHSWTTWRADLYNLAQRLFK